MLLFFLMFLSVQLSMLLGGLLTLVFFYTRVASRQVPVGKSKPRKTSFHISLAFPLRGICKILLTIIHSCYTVAIAKTYHSINAIARNQVLVSFFYVPSVG